MNIITPRVEILYDPGKSDRKYPEDGHLDNHPFLGVIDGYNIPHIPNSPVLFNGITGGQLVRNMIMTGFFSARPHQSLEFLASEINGEIGKVMNIGHQISLKDAGLLPGASVVLGKICEDYIKLIQAGDCYVVWLYESGEIGITENKYYPYDCQAIRHFDWLTEKHEADERTKWEKHGPFLAKIREDHANKNYSIFNGQPEVENCWQKIKIPLKGLKLLILLTDGMISSEQMADEKNLAKDIIELFQAKGGMADTGLKRVLASTRAIERMEQYSHEEHAEATGMALTFS